MLWQNRAHTDKAVPRGLHGLCRMNLDGHRELIDVQDLFAKCAFQFNPGVQEQILRLGRVREGQDQSDLLGQAIENGVQNGLGEKAGLCMIATSELSTGMVNSG